MRLRRSKEKQHSRIQRPSAVECGVLGVCATVAVGLIGGVVGTCSWEAKRRGKLNQAVEADLTAQGYIVKEVLSIIFISPPIRPAATLEVGSCLQSIGVERQDGHWVINPYNLNVASEIEISEHTRVTPEVVNRAFPNCFPDSQ